MLAMESYEYSNNIFITQITLFTGIEKSFMRWTEASITFVLVYFIDKIITMHAPIFNTAP